jgi:hypothetical protein
MERLAMSKTKEILRLRWALERSVRETSRATGVSVGVVSKTENRAKLAELDWSTVEIVPARPGKPRDKAKVEVGVQIAQRWILARLRNETFFSLGELNKRIAELLEDLNARPMKKLGGVSRRELFERVERDVLLPLPSEPFVVSEWKRATGNDRASKRE